MSRVRFAELDKFTTEKEVLVRALSGRIHVMSVKVDSCPAMVDYHFAA